MPFANYPIINMNVNLRICGSFFVRTKEQKQNKRYCNLSLIGHVIMLVKIYDEFK